MKFAVRSSAALPALLLLLAISGCTIGEVRGMVVDQWGKPIETANIQTLPPTHSILSTKEGFVFRDLEDGEYTLLVTKEGYKTGSVQIEVRGKKLTYANVVLQKIED